MGHEHKAHVPKISTYEKKLVEGRSKVFDRCMFGCNVSCAVTYSS